MRALFLIALVASASALSIPILSQALGGIPLLGQIFGGAGVQVPIIGTLPLVGNLLESVGGVLGQLLNNILINVGIIINAVLNIADDLIATVNVIVNGLLVGILDDETVQSILATLPSPLGDLVVDLVDAIRCIVNDLQAAVPPVQKAVIQLIGLLTSPVFGAMDVNAQLAAILNIVGQLTQEEVTVVNTILQRIADALNGEGCNPGIVTMPTPPALPGVSANLPVGTPRKIIPFGKIPGLGGF